MSTELTLETALLLPLVVGFAAAAWWDYRVRRIPNWLVLVLAIAGLAAGFALGGVDALGSRALHGAIGFAIGLVLFAIKAWGGGDGKLYAAAACWFATAQFFTLMFWISLSGVILIAIVFVIRRGKLFRKDAAGLPYGVPIATGTVITYLLTLG